MAAGGPAAAASAGAALLGLALVVWGLVQVPDAHHYRQSSGEGLAFVQTGFLLVGGGLVACGGAAGLWQASRRMGEEARDTAVLAARTIVGAVVLGLAAAVVAQAATR